MRRYLLLLAFWSCFWAMCSCQNSTTDNLKSSPVFDSVIRLAELRFDSGYREQAMAFVYEKHMSISNLTLADHFNYYTFANIRYNRQLNFSASIAISDSILDMLLLEKKSPELDKWIITAYNTKADALFNMGLYAEAYHNYFLARKLATENKDSCALRTYSYSLAMALYKQSRYLESAQHFKEALRQAMICNEDFNQFYFRQEVLDNIGLCYSNIEQFDSSIKYFKQALIYLDANTGIYPHKQISVYEAPKAVVMGNMAEVYRKLGNLDSAILLYKRSIAINLQKGYTNNDALITQAKLADLYLKNARLQDANNVLSLVKIELDTILDKNIEMYWHKLMWQYKVGIGDTLAAYRHLTIYLSSRDSIQQSKKALLETDLDMRVKDIEKQHSIDLLLKDKHTQKLYLIGACTLAALSILVIVFVWRNGQRRKKQLEQLKLANNVIKNQKIQLEDTLVLLEQREKDKVRILRSVAHDIMNPIAAIVSLADILQQETASLDNEQKEIVALIKDAGNSSLTLSRDILEAAQDENELEAFKENIEVNHLVAKCVELLNYRAQEKKQRIITRFSEEKLEARIFGDKIKRVVSNLVTNAIKFSYEGTIIIVEVYNDNGNAHIKVTDTGIGISKDNQDIIFDMFTDAKRTGTAGEVPHGLGLSISQQIIKAHNGKIWFESEEGKGTTFHITFPSSKA